MAMGERYEKKGIVLVLLRPPALAGTESGSLVCLEERYSWIETATEWFRGSVMSPCVACALRQLTRLLLRPLHCLSAFFSRDSELTSCTSFNLRRSLAGICMTSVLSLCSAASPTTGFESTVGLSFAETHGATPCSGRSRATLP